MEKEIEDYLISRTNLLNGQIRGAINSKAREENRQLIELTLSDVFDAAYGLGLTAKAQGEALDKLKEELDIKPNKDEPDSTED